MGEQFAALSAALKDDAPAVRAAAVAGVCRVLDRYWEVIPAAVAAAYVKSMAADLAFDAASPAVRAAVAAGLASLADNALAQPLLGAVLPRLEPMLYDASAKVRAAFADLLLSLRCAPSRSEGARIHACTPPRPAPPIPARRSLPTAPAAAAHRVRVCAPAGACAR
jgi:hypothetical protein